MVARTCPVCHQPVAPGDDVCEQCGALLPAFAAAPVVAPAPRAAAPAAPRACPNCGQPVAPGEDICEHCGAVLAAAPSVARAAPVAVAAPVVAPAECPRCHAPRQAQSRFCNRCGLNFAVTGAEQPPLTPTAIPGQIPIGSVLNGKYRITRAIGAGGMGAVYLAEDQVLKRPVVIKTLLQTDDADLAAQSVKEREFLAVIKHPAIIAIYDFFSVGSDGYIVMEYVQGKTLLQIIEDQGGPLNPADAIRYVLEILPAFTYFAKLELVYCDFKPQNLMLEVLKDGSRVVKLIDLGTVIKYEPHPKDVYGTAGFFAPEAVREPTHQTDLYAICRTLAWMVSLMVLDEPPFGMPPAERYQAFRDNPALYRLLVKGTHTDPARRFQSAEELGEQLAGVLRLIAGGAAGTLVVSRQFQAGASTGRLGPRGEADLDTRDKALTLLEAGDRAFRSGGYAAALNSYQQAIALNKQSVDGYGRLAELHIERGELEQAQDAVARLAQVAPHGWKLAWYTGRVREAQGDYAAAEAQYRAVSDDLPGELPPQQALARVRAAQNDSAGAISLYGGVLKADPGNIEAILGMTTALIALQRWDEVSRILGGVSEAAAKYVDTQLLLCDLFLHRMTPVTAERVTQAAQAVNALVGRTEDPRYYLARGDVYRAALQLARGNKLPADVALPGVARTDARTLGLAAEESYVQYLRAAQNPPDREQIVRRRFEVAPWRLF